MLLLFAATSAIAEPPAPKAGPATPGSTSYCLGSTSDAAYASALFAGENDVFTQRMARLAFSAHLHEKQGVNPTTLCEARPSPAAADAALQTRLDAARRAGRRVVATGWVYPPQTKPNLPASS